MALTYRTPMEDIVSAFDPATQAAIANTAAVNYKNMEENLFSHFNFFLSPVAKQKLSNAGIYLSPFSAVVHSHPACKTLENYILYKVLPTYLDSRFTMIGIKNNKLNSLKSRNPKLQMVELVNRYVTSADVSRYGSEFVCRRSEAHVGLKRHARELCGPTLHDLVPHMMKVTNKYAFIHDELHYWKPQELCTFLEVFSPEVLLGTVVYPPELLIGSTSSLNKWCYEFEIVGSDFMFYPDGVRSEGYLQPINGGYLLKSNKISLASGDIYCVDVICSKFAHHLISITKGDRITPSYRAFAPFDAVSYSALQSISRTARPCIPVSFDIVSRIYRYLRTLKKPDKQSAMAKLSQISPDPSGVEIKFVQEFAELVIDTETIRSTLNPQRLRNFFGKLGQKLPGVLASKIDAVKEMCLDSFIETLEPFTIGIKLKALSHLENFEAWSALDAEAEDDFELPENIEMQFIRGRTRAVPERVARGYVGLPMDCGRGSCRSTWVSRELVLEYGSAAVTRGMSVVEREQCTASLVQEKCRSMFKTSLYFGLAAIELVGDLDELSVEMAKRIQRKARGPKRCDIYTMGLRWFFSGDAADTKYLTQWGEHVAVVPEIGRKWKMCVNEVCSSKFKLRKTKNTRTYTQLLKHVKVDNQESEHARDGNPTEAGSSLADCRANVCTQCVGMDALRSLAYTDHMFKMPCETEYGVVGWYSRGEVICALDGHEYKSLGWPEWLQLWCAANDVAQRYDCCLVQKFAAEKDIVGSMVSAEQVEDAEGALWVNLQGTLKFGMNCTSGKFELGLKEFECLEVGKRSFEGHSIGSAMCTGNSLSARFMCLKTANRVDTIAMEQHEASGAQPEVDKNMAIQPVPRPLYSTELEKVGECTRTANKWLYGSNFKVVETPGDGSCFWHSLSYFMGVAAELIKSRAVKHSFDSEVLNKELGISARENAYATDASIFAAALVHRLEIRVLEVSCGILHCFTVDNPRQICLIRLNGQHFEPILLKNGCVITAVAKLLGRRDMDILAVLEREASRELCFEIWRGAGVSMASIQSVFAIFDIRGVVKGQENTTVLNAQGAFEGLFSLKDDHLEYVGRKKDPCCEPLLVTNNAKVFRAADLDKLMQGGTMIEFKIEHARAKILADSFHSGGTGVLQSEIFNAKANFAERFKRPDGTLVEICVICGVFGSGKSHGFLELMQRSSGKIVDFVAPRRALSDEMQKKLEIPKTKRKAGQENWRICTFEKFLDRCAYLIPGQLVCFDEFQLYPPGYFDLCLSLSVPGVHFVLLGDPCQSNYDNERDRGNFIGMRSNVDKILGGREYKYVVLSKRFLNANFLGRIPAEIAAEQLCLTEEHVIRQGVEYITDVCADFDNVVLVSSFDEKKLVYSYVPLAKVYTFGESTGMTFKRGCILVTSVSERTSELRWLTALTRFRENISFVLCAPLHLQNVMLSYRGRCLAKFLAKTAKVEDLLQILPGKPDYQMSYSRLIGKDEGVREEKLAGDPWLKGMVDLMQAEDQEDVEVLQEICAEEWFKTHLPRDELESVRARWVHRIMAREFRECRMGHLVSEQFTDEYSKQKGGMELSNAAERFEAIYPRHRASDTVTFIMAVKKRLRFSKPAVECAKIMKAQQYGKFLLDEFLKKVPLRRARDTVMLEQARQEFFDKKTSKSAATIENHSGRSCRDWLIDTAQIFSKSQHCTKFDNRFRVAKAAQSIVCFQHEVLCRFAPYMRYIEKKLHQALPDKFYIHSGKGLEELDCWVKKYRFDGVCTESDYEAFDASQDQYIVAFEVAVMNYLGLPRDLVRDYLYIKTHLGSKLGNFAIMRFSGEASTFLFNTMANMLFTFLRYDIRGDEAICFAGDDMCASRRLRIRDEHSQFLGKLRLKAKVQFTNKPTFCGWNLCPDGIYKKPQLVLERMCVAKENNNLANCIDNYAIEVAYAYRMGERAINRMDEEEAASFYNCVRIIVRNKHLLRSNIRNVFELNTLV
ncbi:RNA-dependent RNA polymerase [Hippeastrum latent virus]|uniref:RNA-dependent RNA polymerase n=1 Tax=Hippeastrum latent virus TaxID=335963 RepID=Q4F978_9VIRU|nr:RNA-dependent RNA polymerase [Hippeastrum latent virus]AAZ15106.1 RNA-dependent RNA polymerase [Hippeastrum latent virus]